MQSVQHAQVGEGHKSQLERIRHEVRGGKAQSFTLQLIFRLGLQQRRVLDPLEVNYRVHIMQMTHSETISNGAYSASRARKRGKPTVQLPASGLFGLAPFPPSCESYAVTNSASDKTQNLEAREKKLHGDGVCGVEKKTKVVSGCSRARRTNTPPDT